MPNLLVRLKPFWVADDEAIHCVIMVVALFNFYNRWVDASGVHAMSDEAHRQAAKRSAVHGYIR